MKEQKPPLIERVCRSLDILPESVSNTPYIELHGKSLLKIRNGGRILHYSPKIIKIALPHTKNTLSVIGNDLSCAYYNLGAIGIEGNIETVSFLNLPVEGVGKAEETK